MLSQETTSLDTAFTVLSDSHRRHLLSHLSNSPDTATTVEELAVVLEDDPAAETRLRHVHLPRLEETAIIDYDARTGTVRYRGNQIVEELLTLCLEEQTVRPR